MDFVDQTAVPRIALFAAMQWECRPLLRNLRQVRRERIGELTAWRAQTPRAEVVVVKTGVGPRQAHEAATALKACGHFSAFISTGCAGGLLAAAAPGDVVLATMAVNQITGKRFATDPSLTDQLHAMARQRGLTTHRGPMLCVENALSTAAAKRLAAANGHIAVEMEGAAIAACAAATDTPYVAIRTILDGAEIDLGEGGSFIDPLTGAVRPWSLAKYVATQPGAISNLLAMQRWMQAAQSSLDRFFGGWFAALPSTSLHN